MSIETWYNTAENLRSVFLDSSHHSNVEAADQQQQQQVQEAGGRDAMNGNNTMEQTNNQGTLRNGNGQVYPPTHIWLPQEEHQGRAQENQGTLNPPYPAAALAQLLDWTMPEFSHEEKFMWTTVDVLYGEYFPKATVEVSSACSTEGVGWPGQ
eukprot:scaffold5114_cov67-Cylindrotheca_fusiformis.AAC.10